MTRRGRGEGTIYRGKDGRWRGELHTPGGKRKDVYGKTRQEVQRKLAQVRRDVEVGLPVVGDRQTVGDFLVSWLEMIEPALRPRTLESYRDHVRVHLVPEIGQMKLSKLTPQRVQELYAAKLKSGLSRTTVHHLHATLHRALEMAVRLQVVARNVCDAVDPPGFARREMHVLTREQALALLDAIQRSGDRLYALYVLALATGMRQGELLGLHWSDVDLDRDHDHGQLWVRSNLQWSRDRGQYVFGEPKTKAGHRMIELAPLFVETLREHRARQLAERLALGPGWVERDLVFCSRVGTPMDANHLRARFGRHVARLAAAGIVPRIRFHDLRHTAATLMRSQGVEVEVISRVLGHSSPAVTMNIYVHVFPQQHRDASAAMARALSSGAGSSV